MQHVPLPHFKTNSELCTPTSRALHLSAAQVLLRPRPDRQWYCTHPVRRGVRVGEMRLHRHEALPHRTSFLSSQCHTAATTHCVAPQPHCTEYTCLPIVHLALPFSQVTWIAASRLYLGLHTPVDILAGALAGLAVLVCFISVEGGWAGGWVGVHHLCRKLAVAGCESGARGP